MGPGRHPPARPAGRRSRAAALRRGGRRARPAWEAAGGGAAGPHRGDRGSVDRTRDFDRHFRPTSSVARARFERLATAARRGEDLPPVDLYRVGRGRDALYFVLDGHHRIAVAAALDREVVNARVTEIVTQLPMGTDLRGSDLVMKTHERLFGERVPLPQEVRDAIRLRDPADYARLAEGVEAWGFRIMQVTGEMLDRAAVAARWWTQEYEPAVRLLRQAGLIDSPQPDTAGAGALPGSDATTDTEAYLRLSAQRYLLLRSHRWDDGALDRLRAERPRRARTRRRSRPQP